MKADMMNALARSGAALGVFAASVAAPAAAEMRGLRQSTQADRIVASITFNFARFAQWKGDNGGAAGPLTLCVLDSGASDAWATFEGEDVGGRPLAVKVFSDAEAAGEGCDIAYLSDAARTHNSPRSLAKAGVLTISDSANFARRGGAIELLVRGSKFQFEINDQALKEAGVRISSKLLRVGMKVSVPGEGGANDDPAAASRQAGR
jgi:hypothetical protein